MKVYLAENPSFIKPLSPGLYQQQQKMVWTFFPTLRCSWWKAFYLYTTVLLNSPF